MGAPFDCGQGLFGLLCRGTSWAYCSSWTSALFNSVFELQMIRCESRGVADASTPLKVILQELVMIKCCKSFFETVIEVLVLTTEFTERSWTDALHYLTVWLYNRVDVPLFSSKAHTLLNKCDKDHSVLISRMQAVVRLVYAVVSRRRRSPMPMRWELDMKLKLWLEIKWRYF